MESPLVSIIVPIYNAAMDMVPCLESIKHQRYQNLEVLLVNDGSSDASLEICRMYARLDPRVIIIDKENIGVSGTRNAAIARAANICNLWIPTISSTRTPRACWWRPRRKRRPIWSSALLLRHAGWQDHGARLHAAVYPDGQGAVRPLPDGRARQLY